MSELEIQEFSDRLDRGLELAERRMLEDKARRNENIIICGKDNVIRSVPAKEFL